MPDFSLRPLVSADIPAALALWHHIPGLGMGLSDSPEELVLFLQRNPGLSRIASVDDQFVGTAMCGHDGRRGFLYHVAVDQAHQRQSIGRSMVESCISQLGRCGIKRTAIHLFSTNDVAVKFWQSIGWHLRDDLAVMQIQPLAPLTL